MKLKLRKKMHIEIRTLHCGKILTDWANVTLQHVGDTYLVMISGDSEWKQIAAEEHKHLVKLLKARTL